MLTVLPLLTCFVAMFFGRFFMGLLAEVGCGKTVTLLFTAISNTFEQ